jgi:peptidoglycan/xylan/chitin deacetylase (PgdA/CDA1 family)
MSTITLSFDNGPEPDVTPLVLDTLRRHDLKATFFVIGGKLRQRRALSERAHAEGHWIGNHTFNHLVPLGLTAEHGIATSEIDRTRALIGDLVHPDRLFRPFGGEGILDRRLLNREALDHLIDGSYTCVLWNVIPEDWRHPTTWVERTLTLCAAEDHALVVLHDLPTGAMAHLDRFLETARERGHTFQQPFPASCMPIVRGRIVSPIDAYLTKAPVLTQPPIRWRSQQACHRAPRQ